MDSYTAGLAYHLSPLAKVSYPHPDNEDAYYAVYEPWAPGWLTRLIAAAGALRAHHPVHPASVSVTRMA